LPLRSGADSDGQPIGADYWIGAAIVIAILHSIDAVMTHHYGKKGLHPA